MVRVGLDLDGTVFASEIEFIRIGEQLGVDDSFLDEYNGMWRKMTQDGRNFGTVLMNDYRDDWLETVGLYEDTLEAYELFSNDPDMDISFVTQRDKDTKIITEARLSEFGMYAPVFYYKNKLQANVQVLIDDNPKQVKNFLEAGRLGILMKHRYNNRFDLPYKVDTLTEAYELVRGMI